jgi:hypothetical protein
MDEGMPTTQPVIEVDVELLDEAEWNPNEQDPPTFNALVENIREVGMVEFPVVIPIEGTNRYKVVSGNHRFRAVKLLGWPRCPVVVAERWDDDMAKAQTVRMNMIRGKLDPVKFTKLAREFVARYGTEGTAQLFKFPNQVAFDKIFLDLKRSLPVTLGSKLEQERKKVRTVKDLANVLEDIMAKAGQSVQQSYVVFSYAGREHLYVALDSSTKRDVWKMKALADEHVKDLNHVLSLVMEGGMPYAKSALEMTLGTKADTTGGADGSPAGIEGGVGGAPGVGSGGESGVLAAPGDAPGGDASGPGVPDSGLGGGEAPDGPGVTAARHRRRSGRSAADGVDRAGPREGVPPAVTDAP